MHSSTFNPDDLLQRLGEVVGVSELAYNNNQNTGVSAPVLVAENALVFFAWSTEDALYK